MGDRWKSVYFSRKARRQRGENPRKIVVLPNEELGTMKTISAGRERNNLYELDLDSNQAGIVDSAKACPTMCTAEDRTHATNGVDSGDLRILPMQFNSNDDNTFYHVMAYKKNDMQQACLRAFQKKRDELCQQQRLLEDEIARCEMNIQTLSRVGEGNWTRKVEIIIEALDSSCSSQVQMYWTPEEEDPSQTAKRRKLSETVYTSRNTCQEGSSGCNS